jgi:hypothetical protein
MRQSIYTETADDVLSTVRAAGQKVSRAQLTRWHVFGVIPSPIQRHRPGIRGTETVYPAGTSEQVLAAAPLVKQIRIFDDVRVQLWLRGFTVERGFIAYGIRQTLYSGLDLSDSFLASFGAAAQGIKVALSGDAADKALSRVSEDELYSLSKREPGIALRHAISLIPFGYVVEWDRQLAFIARWFLASRLPFPKQRIATALIIFAFLARAKPIPGLAPKRPRGRPRKVKV